MHTANMQAVKALGNSKTFLNLEIIKKSLELVCLLLVMKISVMAIAVNMAILTTLFTFINAYPNIKLLGYTFKEQMNDIIYPIAMSFIMAICVYFVGKIPYPDIVLLTVQVVVGLIIYISLALLTKNEEMKFLINLVFKRSHHE